MAHAYFHKLEHSQKQILAPLLQQNMQILLLNTMDLLQEINKRLDENPFLETEKDEARNIAIEKFIDNKIKKESISEISDDEFDHYKENIYEDTNYTIGDRQKPSDNNSKQNFLENTIVHTESIYDYLKNQLKLLNLEKKEEEIADVILSSVDERGILKTSLEDISKYVGTNIQKVEDVLKKIQELEPAGIGSRNSQEYILIQIEQQYNKSSLYYQVTKTYFEIFDEFQKDLQSKTEDKQDMQYNALKIRKKIVKEVAVRLNMESEDIESILKEIESKINPNPIFDFKIHETNINYIVPDIIVTLNIEDSSLDIKIFDDYLPKLKINQDYRDLLKNQKDRDNQQNIQELKNKFEEAKNFVNLIKRRKSTLYNLTLHLIDIQKDFFLKGKEYIKPITIKEIADILKVHESTISRIVNNKYISTPIGVFPLKYLFSHYVEGNKPDVSAKKITAMIKKIIETEGGKKKLSDDKITKILNNMGINISRRTIAKYRKNLNIRSSFER